MSITVSDLSETCSFIFQLEVHGEQVEYSSTGKFPTKRLHQNEYCLYAHSCWWNVVIVLCAFEVWRRNQVYVCLQTLKPDKILNMELYGEWRGYSASKCVYTSYQMSGSRSNNSGCSVIDSPFDLWNNNELHSRRFVFNDSLSEQ